MLRLIQSNQMGVLSRLFCEERQIPTDALLPRTVIVQSHALGQWLKLQLAENQGISANLECILPATYIWRVYQTFLTGIDLPDKSLFDRELLTWRLMRIIPRLNEKALEKYLERPGDKDIRLFQLSQQIAGLYDQYLVYRPEWLIEWEETEPKAEARIPAENHWQIKLWRELVKDVGELANTHRAKLHARLLRLIKHRQLADSEFPKSLSIFGVSSMAPLHLETFQNLSIFMDIDVYFLNPCEHYWGDILAPKELAKRSIKDRYRGGSNLSDEDHLTMGNPLLSSFGKEGREYLDLLIGSENISTHELFIENENDSMLGFIKNDILKLEYGGQIGNKPIPRALVDSDKSIQIHSVHSQMREIEVLKDNLLSIFSKDDSVKPKDVIVMAPDITEYAPSISAVFKEHIRYGIADRTDYDSSRIISAFLKILTLPSSRLTNIEVLDLLEIPSVARRFQLDEADRKIIENWIHKTEIRWEYHGEEKSSRWNLPADNFNTWQFGLDRLLLGYAIENGFYNNCLAHPISESDSELLGTLCHVISLIEQTRGDLSKRYSVADWSDLLYRIISDFFLPEDREVLNSEQLKNAIDAMVSDTKASGFTDVCNNQVIIQWLEQRLSRIRQSTGVIRGGITFATLVPMRSIPFKIVCLIGMNDLDFPRRQKPISFDLMQITGPRQGDRSSRIDDRYLFLEAILSAQKILYLSFQGRGSKDNLERPPSSVLSELLDYVCDIFPDFKITHHPLQPFSRKYYDGSIVSYDQVWFEALNQDGQFPAFIDKPLKILKELQAETMDQLIKFIEHPAKYFFNTRLNIFFDQEEQPLQGSEPFEPNNLDRYKLKTHALHEITAGKDTDQLRNELFATGKVLNKEYGKKLLDQEIEVARSVSNAVTAMSHDVATSIIGSVPLQNRKLSFSVATIYGNKQIDIRPSKLQKRQLLGVWIKHLCLSASGYNLESVAISYETNRVKKLIFDAIPKAEAKNILEKIVSIHDRGICQPLHFLPQYSFDYFEEVRKGTSTLEALNKVRAKWQIGGIGSETQDRYWKRLNHSSPLFDDVFKQTALEVYNPLFLYWRQS